MPQYLSQDPGAGEPLEVPVFRETNAKDAAGNPVVAPESALSLLTRLISDPAVGAMKGLGRSAVGYGQAWHQVPGVSEAVDALYRLAGVDLNSSEMFADGDKLRTGLGLDPTSALQKLGMFIEQAGELVTPSGAATRAAAGITAKVAPHLAHAPSLIQGAASLVPRVALQGSTAAGVTAAQGGDPVTAATVAGSLPIAGGAVRAAGRAIGKTAVPLVRSGIKQTVTAAKRQAGASTAGINAQTDRLARFIIDHRLTSPEKAEALIADTEQALQSLLKGTKAATDAPQRAMRYVQALERSAAKQGLPAEDVAVLRRKAAELLEDSPLSEDVIRIVRQASPSGLVDASGKPVMVDVAQKSRALRSDVAPDEALEIARGSSRWGNRKAWGERKGAAVEADKAVERASRDAVKQAVPASKPLLRRQGQAIQAKQTLERQAFREANRDPVGLPAHVLAAGGHGILAFATNLLRNNAVRAGIYADQLAQATARKDVRKVTEILTQISAAATVQAQKPLYAR